MQFDERTMTNAGVALALWCRHQIELRAWVREIEDDVVYFALEAMRNQAPRLVMRRFDQSSMAGRQRGEIDREQFFKRGKVSLHVPVGRRNDHRRALHDVVASEKNFLLFE